MAKKIFRQKIFRSRLFLMTLLTGAMFTVVFCSSKERAFDGPIVSATTDRPKYEKPQVEEEMPSLDFKFAFFDLDKAVLKPEAKKSLTPAAQWMKKNPSVNIQIEGFCDKRGSDAYNLQLGERRAKAAKEFLVSQGIPASHITTMSYGRVEGDSDMAMAQNRRAGVVVIFPK